MDCRDDAERLRSMADEIRSGDPAGALERYIEASDMGDVKASSSAGYMLMVGEGCDPDPESAEVHLKRAAESGDQTAQCNLGALMSSISRPEEAVRWFRAAAESGSITGMRNLASMLATGIGTERDCTEAARLYSEAAGLGDLDSMCMLAVMHRNGQGIPIDKLAAAELYRRAADLGDPGAQYDLAFMLDTGEGIPVDHEEAERLFRLSAGQGDNDARLCLGGILYERGDLTEAVDVFMDAAMDGDVKAMYNLGLIYSDERFEDHDPAKAEEWFLGAAESGFAYGQMMMGCACLNRGDMESAESWFRKSASQGEPTSKYNLGALALSGKICMDDRDAIRLVTEAAMEGVQEAADLISRLSSQGAL